MNKTNNAVTSAVTTAAANGVTSTATGETRVRKRLLICLGAGLVLTLSTLLSPHATADDGHRWQRAVGTWLFTIDFGPGGPAPFREFITLHRGGTLTETNTTLNANSATDPTAPLPLNGSDGQGTWRRVSPDTVAFTLHKMVFCGAIPLNGPEGTCADNALFGFLRVDGRLRIRGDQAQQIGAESRTVLLAPNLEDLVFDFGGADATGVRLR